MIHVGNFEDSNWRKKQKWFNFSIYEFRSIQFVHNTQKKKEIVQDFNFFFFFFPTHNIGLLPNFLYAKENNYLSTGYFSQHSVMIRRNNHGYHLV